jgi:hypothetical protein
MDGLPEHGDIRDWLKTYTSNDLARLIEEAKPAPDDPVWSKNSNTCWYGSLETSFVTHSGARDIFSWQ